MSTPTHPTDGATVAAEISQVTPPRSNEKKTKGKPLSAYVSHEDATKSVPLISNQSKVGGVEKTSPHPDLLMELRTSIETMTKMELRNQYPAEANCHRNMLSRRQAAGATVHPAFHDFRSFLLNVGPKPTHDATLDRIDNKDPEYAPGKVRWADKRTQNGNKGDTLLFYCSQTGQTYTSSRLSKIQNVSANAIRTRYHRGWTDDEIIAGQRISTSSERPEILPAPRQSSFHEAHISIAKSMREVQFERDAEFCKYHRETIGAEYFEATPRELIVSTPEYFPSRKAPEYWRHFMTVRLPEYWKRYRTHVKFDGLEPHQRRLIAQIDPSMRNRIKLDL